MRYSHEKLSPCLLAIMRGQSVIIHKVVIILDEAESWTNLSIHWGITSTVIYRTTVVHWDTPWAHMTIFMITSHLLNQYSLLSRPQNAPVYSSCYTQINKFPVQPIAVATLHSPLNLIGSIAAPNTNQSTGHQSDTSFLDYRASFPCRWSHPSLILSSRLVTFHHLSYRLHSFNNNNK